MRIISVHFARASRTFAQRFTESFAVEFEANLYRKKSVIKRMCVDFQEIHYRFP